MNDINGDALVPGQEYCIVSGIRGAGGGGVTPERNGDSIPHHVPILFRNYVLTWIEVPSKIQYC